MRRLEDDERAVDALHSAVLEARLHNVVARRGIDLSLRHALHRNRERRGRQSVRCGFRRWTRQRAAWEMVSEAAPEASPGMREQGLAQRVGWRGESCQCSIVFVRAVLASAGARVSRQREGRRAWRRGAVILQARPRGGFGGRGSARQGGEATCVLVEGAVVSGEREHRWQRNRAPARWCVVPKEFPQEMRRYRPPQVALRWAAGVLQALPRVPVVLLSLSAGVRATAPCAPLPLSSRLLTRALRRPFLPSCMLSLRVPRLCGTQ